MKLYRVDDGTLVSPLYAATRTEAHKIAKTQFGRFGVEVELIDVPVDKQNVVDMLGGGFKFTVLKRWSLTDRGGLREVVDT
jgi:hypothetical protein